MNRCIVPASSRLLANAAGGTQLINLRGQFIESKGKGPSFVDSLKNDKKAHVFSIVILDGDNADNTRAVTKAAKDGHFFGRFFILEPDFEFANFTLHELVDVLLKLAAHNIPTCHPPMMSADGR